MARRSINNLGDVRIALNEIYDTLDLLTTKPQDLKGRLLSNIGDPIKLKDAVNLQTLQDYVREQLIDIKKLIPNKEPQAPPNAANIVFAKNIVPKTNSMYSIGSALLLWLKGWFTDINVDSLTASKPVKSDASKNLVTGQIALASDVSGTLPIANGGTGSTTAAGARTNLSAAALPQTVSGANFSYPGEGPINCAGSQTVTVDGSNFIAPAGGGACSGSFDVTIDGVNFNVTISSTPLSGSQALS